MPKSKNKRRNGKTSSKYMVEKRRLREVRRRWQSGQKIDLEQTRKDAKIIADWKARIDKPLGIDWLLQLKVNGGMTEAAIKGLVALDRWPTTMDRKDFDIPASALMMGFMALHCMEIENHDEVETVIREAAFMTFLCARLRCKGSPLPAANLQIVRLGLMAAQDCMQMLIDTDMSSMMKILETNSKQNCRAHPKEHDERVRQMLGPRYAEQIFAWEAADDRGGMLFELQPPKYQSAGIKSEGTK